MAGHIPCKIEAVALSDAPALSQVNTKAYWADPVSRGSWTSPVTLEELIKQQTYKIADVLVFKPEIVRHVKAVDPESGEVLGYLRVALPIEHATTPSGPQWAEFQIPAVSPEEVQRIEEDAVKHTLFKQRSGTVEEKAFAKQKEILADRVCMKLRYLAVSPEHQRKGIGKALVELVTRKADELGLDVYLMGYDAGRGLYERLGFEEIDRVVGDGTEGHNSYFMMYYPKK